MTSDTPSLRVQGLRVAYDDRVVIDGLDLEIPPGQITTIVGANACGKSTLLRTLARLLEPYALIWIHLALRRGFGTNWGFGLLRGKD